MKLSRLEYLAAVHAGEASDAAWLAHFADIPMSWLGDAP